MSGTSLAEIKDTYRESVEEVLEKYNLLLLNNTIEEIFTTSERERLIDKWRCQSKRRAVDAAAMLNEHGEYYAPLIRLDYIARVYSVCTALIEFVPTGAVSISCCEYTCKFDVLYNTQKFIITINPWKKSYEFKWHNTTQPRDCSRNTKSIRMLIKLIKTTERTQGTTL